MTLSVVCAVLFLICFGAASCAYCDPSQIRFPGVVVQERPFPLRPGESFVPSCQRGYRRSVPNGRLTCENGVWSGHFPPCVIDDCKMPAPSIPNGKPKPYKRDHFSKVQYACNEHFFLHTASSVQCSFGAWVGTPPHCKDSRCTFAGLKKKEGVIASEYNRTLSGHHLVFQCAPGFVRVGVNPLCTRGTWVEYGLSPCKENNCIVPDIRHGDLMEAENREVWKWKKMRRENKTVLKKVKKGSTVPVGKKLELVCDSKYSYEGKGQKSVETVCRRGVWVPTPLCSS